MKIEWGLNLDEVKFQIRVQYWVRVKIALWTITYGEIKIEGNLG